MPLSGAAVVDDPDPAPAADELLDELFDELFDGSTGSERRGRQASPRGGEQGPPRVRLGELLHQFNPFGENGFLSSTYRGPLVTAMLISQGVP